LLRGRLFFKNLFIFENNGSRYHATTTVNT
jgi:hypothetical protein